MIVKLTDLVEERAAAGMAAQLPAPAHASPDASVAGAAAFPLFGRFLQPEAGGFV